MGMSPTDIVVGGGRLSPSRRVLLGSLGAAALALGANFVGCTSFLLGLQPDLARHGRLDLLFAVQGFKRCLETNFNFEFIYPASWLGDQRLVYRAAARGERERALDPPPLSGRFGAEVRSSSSGARRPGAGGTPLVEPVVAFGPAGGTGELNVSVIVAPVGRSFRLETFGDAAVFGERLLADVIAPPGSGIVATLLDARQCEVDGVLYYQLEYTVESASFSRHNIAVCCVQNSELFTLNAQSPEAMWHEVQSQFQTVAQSFRVPQT